MIASVRLDVVVVVVVALALPAVAALLLPDAALETTLRERMTAATVTETTTVNDVIPETDPEAPMHGITLPSTQMTKSSSSPAKIPA